MIRTLLLLTFLHRNNPTSFFFLLYGPGLPLPPPISLLFPLSSNISKFHYRSSSANICVTCPFPMVITLFLSPLFFSFHPSSSFSCGNFPS
ncbi:hypothetical protein HOY80DRAFT_992923 [Tuber brumale]|nr:hypothetical protein HOY80DRAFT_992923 [Tuber brumale]